jgi:hypothetical protein
MPQKVQISLSAVNIALLDQQLKAALPAVCYGLNQDGTGLFAIVSDDASPAALSQIVTIANAHNPNAETAEQTATRVGSIDMGTLLAKIDQAITDINTKQTTFKGSPTLGTAAPLLNEIADDMIGLLKAFKYLAKRVNGQLS